MAKSWIQVFSGQEVDYDFDYYQPEAWDWKPHSIAHHLANIIRYTGAARRNYTVAEHSWRVGLYAADLVRHYGKFANDTEKQAAAFQAARAGTMHDAPEMVVGDVNSPLKRLDFMAGFRAYENTLHPMVAARFNLVETMVEFEGQTFNVVTSADLTALNFERKQLLGREPRPWAPIITLPIIESVAFEGQLGMTGEEAEQLFLNACKILQLK